MQKKITEPCPLDLCDGSGVIEQGEYDDISTVTCPHVKEEKDSDELQDQQ